MESQEWNHIRYLPDKFQPFVDDLAEEIQEFPRNARVYYSQKKDQYWFGEFNQDYNTPHGMGILILLTPIPAAIYCETSTGAIQGQCLVRLEDGRNFQAEFYNQTPSGKFDVYEADKTLIMRVKVVQDGNCEIEYPLSGYHYIGRFFLCLRHGRGKMYNCSKTTNDNVMSDGQWELDHFDTGYVKQPYYIGELGYGGLYHGQGTVYYDEECTVKRLQGKFHQGVIEGNGKEFYNNPTNDLRYRGGFLNGVYHSDGDLVLFEPAKRIYRGKFQRGVLDSQILIFDENEKLLQKASFKDGVLQDTDEEVFYDITLSSTGSVSEYEIKQGSLQVCTFHKVTYSRGTSLGTLKYYRNMDDPFPDMVVHVNRNNLNGLYPNVVASQGSYMVYTGDLEELYYSGKGTMRYACKYCPKKYVGDFQNGLYHGEGMLYSDTERLLYKGGFHQNKFHGSGILTLFTVHIANNDKIELKQIKKGAFCSDVFDMYIEGKFDLGEFQGGKWKYVGRSKHKYTKKLEILVEKGSAHLQGKLYDDERKLYFEGDFVSYEFEGIGTLYYPDGKTKKYEGDFYKGSFDGFGKLYAIDGSKIYEGRFQKGAFHGLGKLTKGGPGCLAYRGQFENGKITGDGVLYSPNDDQDIRKRGQFENSRLVSGYMKLLHPNTSTVLYEGEAKFEEYEGEGTLYHSSGEIEKKGIFRKGQLVDGLNREFYNDGTLFREGQLRDGAYIGTVTQYYFDQKKYYEGELKGDKKHGKGITYHRNGEIHQKGAFEDDVFIEGEVCYYYTDSLSKKFEGLVSKNMFNGFGKKYHGNGNIEYEGQFVNGLYEGNGTLYYYEKNQAVKYEGQFQHGAPKGRGKIFNIEGKLIYEGSVKDLKKHGSGAYFSEKGEKLAEGIFEEDALREGHFKEYWNGMKVVKYEGEIKDELRNGFGKKYFLNGNLEYEGQFRNSKFQGHGVLYSEENENQKIYEGEFMNGHFSGKGTLYEEDEIYTGEFRHGKKNGQGTIKYKKLAWGTKAIGTFVNGNLERGRLFLKNSKGTFIFTGEILNGKYHGEGTKYFENGIAEYEGMFRDGLYHGIGTLYDKSGKIIHDGQFDRGQRV